MVLFAVGISENCGFWGFFLFVHLFFLFFFFNVLPNCPNAIKENSCWSRDRRAGHGTVLSLE